MRSKQRRSTLDIHTSTILKVAGFLFIALALQAAYHGAAAETLVWDARPATSLMGSSTDTATINAVNIVTSGTRTGSFDSAGLNQHEIQPTSSLSGHTGFVFSIFNGTADNESNSQTTTLTFSEPVYNVTFAVGDIDGGTTYNDGTNSFTDIIEFRANGGSVFPSSGTPVDASRVNWNSGTGRATAISNVNLGDNTGDITVTFAGPVNSLTIRHIGGDTAMSNPTQQGVAIDDVTFRRSPRLALNKTSNGDVGPFNYTITNGFSGTIATSVTTVTSGTSVTGTQFRLGSINTATTVTETVPTGWKIGASATCTDANAVNSGNPSSFSVAISGAAFSIAAANIRAAAELTCALVNSKLPTLQLRKISTGGTGSFNFSGDNGYGTATITTTVQGSPTAIAARTLGDFSTTTTIIETIPPNYSVTGVNCSGLGSGSATPNLTTGTVVLNAAATAPGNVITCTYSNDMINPALSILKSANTAGPVNAGQVITYTYHITNTGNQHVSGITISELFNGTGTPPVPSNETLFADNSPNGDSTDSTSNNGTWSNLGPGDIITFTAPYTVQQTDIEQLQ